MVLLDLDGVLGGSPPSSTAGTLLPNLFFCCREVFSPAGHCGVTLLSQNAVHRKVLLQPLSTNEVTLSNNRRCVNYLSLAFFANSCELAYPRLVLQAAATIYYFSRRESIARGPAHIFLDRKPNLVPQMQYSTARRNDLQSLWLAC